MGIQIVYEGGEPNQDAIANFKFGRQVQGAGQTISASQPPKPKESLNGSAPYWGGWTLKDFHEVSIPLKLVKPPKIRGLQ